MTNDKDPILKGRKEIMGALRISRQTFTAILKAGLPVYQFTPTDAYRIRLSVAKLWVENHQKEALKNPVKKKN